MPLTINAGFSYNHILVYDLLGQDEKIQTGRWLEDDLLHYADGEENAGLTRYQIKSEEDLLIHFSRLGQEISKTNLHPIVHFEAHGDSEKGLIIGETEEYLSWAKLNESLQKINVLLENNLVVVISSCFGAHLLTQISPVEPCPYFLLIGPDIEIQKSILASELPAFYKKLLTTNDIGLALEKLSGQFVKTFTVEFFFTLMHRYFLEECVGKAKQERIERLTTFGREEGLIKNRKQMQAFRKLARKYYGLNKEVLLKYSKIFFHGTVTVPVDGFFSSIRLAATKKASSPTLRA